MISQRHMNDFIKDFFMLVWRAGSDTEADNDDDDDGNDDGTRNPFDASFNHIKNKADKGTLSSLVVW